MTRRILLSLGLALTLLVSACTTNPATGEKNFNMLGQAEEIQMGNKIQPEFLASYGGEIPSPEIRNYVSSLGQRLAAVSERPDLPWEFHVVDSSVINAFALPGGKVFMSRALMEKMTNEAQLAGVLGHEVGHVTAQHIGQQMSQQTALQVGLAVLGAAGGQSAYMQALGVGAQAGGSLYLLKFGRDQESQADELGVRYMSKLGFNPKAQVEVMQILKAASGKGGSTPEMLSTHPLPSTRIDRLNALIKRTYPDADAPGKYTYGEASFQPIRAALSKLPPPKHTGK
ncbi:MAG: M48 family metalloprotease [Phycisphaeraceae bacterium]|nr:M48 family metalloprotease [Phycisphaeraceae bacterium]